MCVYVLNASKSKKNRVYGIRLEGNAIDNGQTDSASAGVPENVMYENFDNLSLHDVILCQHENW